MKDVYLPSESQRALMRMSRQALENFVRRRRRQVPETADSYLLTAEYGAFVSLHKEEELRGCMGNCVPQAALVEIVTEMTEAAASRDGRMEPVAEAELAEIRIDITVLSPLARASDPLGLKVGRHGLHVVCGAKRGVLLPQVATQYGWDMGIFLEQTCLKAGLPKNAWKERNTQVSAFTALIIEESI
jgi:uncharacterized protein